MTRKRKKKHLTDVVDSVVDKAFNIIEWKFLMATDQQDDLPEDYFQYDLEKLDAVLAIAKPLLTSAQQTRRVEAETSKDIVSLISKGKVTLEEAIKLMTLTKLRLDVENKEMKKSVQKKLLEEISVNIKE